MMLRATSLLKSKRLYCATKSLRQRNTLKKKSIIHPIVSQASFNYFNKRYYLRDTEEQLTQDLTEYREGHLEEANEIREDLKYLLSSKELTLSLEKDGVHLTKSIEGKDVLIVVHSEPTEDMTGYYYKNIQEEEEEDDTDLSQTPDFFTVTVSKKNYKGNISLLCAVKKETIYILHVNGTNQGNEQDQLFSDLPENLQNSFEDYLLDIGIDKEFCTLVDLCLDLHDNQWEIGFADNVLSFLK